MKILVTGASGWVASAVIPELIEHGHDVVGMARSDESAQVVKKRGAVPLRGDVTDSAALKAALADVDGVIHLAFNHDFTNFDGAVAQDAATVTAIGEALTGTNKPFVLTGGTPALPGKIATESDLSEFGPAAAREANADIALAFAEKGVRVSVIRLPRSVHGIGDTGFIPQIAGIGKQAGVSGFVGDGDQRWPAVHVKDAATLYRLAVESGKPGSRYHAIGDEGVSVRQIADAIGKRLDLPVRSVSPEPYGFLGMLMGIDQPASAVKTREELEWAPAQPSLLDDLANPEYLAAI